MSDRPQAIVQVEPGCVNRVGEVLNTLPARSVFLVADRAAYRISGAETALANALATRHVVSFFDFQPNPRLEDVTRGVEIFRQNPCDAVLAVGGGTAIDTAKLISILAVQHATLQDVVTGESQITAAGPPLIVVPTTAGTGSEATHFAVVYVAGHKYSLAHPTLLPAYAFVDSQLTESLPASLTASTGLDALCQAIESLWSVNSTVESREFARHALQLAWANLPAAVNQPTPTVRAAMCQAATFAGQAINISKTTAPHALSYKLTSGFQVPHGHAVALTLAPTLLFNSQVTQDDVNDPRGAAHVRSIINEIVKLMGATSVESAAAQFAAMLDSINLASTLSDVGVTSDADLELLADSVNVERLGNNPRQAGRNDLLAILAAARTTGSSASI